MARNFSCPNSELLCILLGGIIYQVPLGFNASNGPLVEYCSSTSPTCGTGIGSGYQGTATTWNWSVTGSAVTIQGSSTSPTVTLHGNAVGTSTVSGTARDTYGCQVGCGGNMTVIDFLPTGNSFFFVGTDAAFTGQYGTNKFAARNGAQNNVAMPAGGTFTGTSSYASDSFSSGTTSGFSTLTVTTNHVSSSTGDRSLTFTYAVSGVSESKPLSVTAKQIAYAKNDSLVNGCTLGYCYDYMITYTPYTHPDGIAVPYGIFVDYPIVTETFSPTQITCNNITGNGSLNTNSQFVDHISYCCNNKPPVCSSTNTQTIKIAGQTIHTNTLTITDKSLTYSSQGPTQ